MEHTAPGEGKWLNGNHSLLFSSLSSFTPAEIKEEQRGGGGQMQGSERWGSGGVGVKDTKNERDWTSQSPGGWGPSQLDLEK